MISYGKQSIDETDIKAVKNVLRSNFLTQGPLVDKFESVLKNFFKSKFATVVSNASVALFLIGKVLKWKKGDLIAVSPITFISSVNSIEHCGASPVFVDINLSDYCMDPNRLEDALKRDKKKKIKAAIITDYGGHPADWEKFLQLKKKYNIKLINDFCHAMGSSINNDIGYAAKFADFVSLSFHPVKAITTGEGGAILSKSSFYDHQFKLLRSHGILRDVNKPWKYDVSILGYNFRLPDLNCALGCSQIKRLNKFIKKRQKIAKFYNLFFSDKSKFTILENKRNIVNSYHLYPLLVNFKKIKKTKEQIIKEFLEKKIRIQVHYIPVNSQPYYKRKYKLDKEKTKNSFFFHEREISLPIYYDLTFKDLNYIKNISKKIFQI